MSVPAVGTLLVLTGQGVPYYSCRGAKQTLTPITQSAQVERSINGGLINLSASQFQKYSSTITCTDQMPPAVDASWAGLAITVQCACYLSYATGGTPQRTVVSASSFTDNGFVFYRPQLSMKIISPWNIDWDEWQHQASWTLNLEEV
jgi:hypothetical protein